MAALHRRIFTAPWDRLWDEIACREMLRLAGARCRFAEIDGDPVGFLLWRQILDEGEILSLGILPEWRRRGIAESLLRDALAEGGKAGLRRLFLEVAEANRAAYDLYAKLGFSPCGDRPNYGADGSSARILQLSLI